MPAPVTTPAGSSSVAEDQDVPAVAPACSNDSANGATNGKDHASANGSSDTTSPDERLVMLREKLLHAQAEQKEDECPSPSTVKSSGSCALERFLTEDSNRVALQALQDKLAHGEQKGGPATGVQRRRARNSLDLPPELPVQATSSSDAKQIKKVARNSLAPTEPIIKEVIKPADEPLATSKTDKRETSVENGTSQRKQSPQNRMDSRQLERKEEAKLDVAQAKPVVNTSSTVVKRDTAHEGDDETVAGNIKASPMKEREASPAAPQPVPPVVQRNVRGRGAARYGSTAAGDELTLRSTALERGSRLAEDVDDDRLRASPPRVMSRGPTASHQWTFKGQRSSSWPCRCSRSRSRRSARSRSSSSSARSKACRRRSSKSRRRSRSRSRDKKTSKAKSKSRSRRGSRSRNRKRKDRSKSCRKSRSRSRKRSKSKNRKRSRSRSRKRSSGRKRSRSRSKKRSHSRGRRKSASRSRKSKRSKSRGKKGHDRSRRRSKSRHRPSSTAAADRPAFDAPAFDAPAFDASASSAMAPVDQEEAQRLLEVFPAFSRVLLKELVKNLELNGQWGIVMPPGASSSPDVVGCLKVRLDSGREVAVKPANVQLVAAGSPGAAMAAQTSPSMGMQQHGVVGLPGQMMSPSLAPSMPQHFRSQAVQMVPPPPPPPPPLPQAVPQMMPLGHPADVPFEHPHIAEANRLDGCSVPF